MADLEFESPWTTSTTIEVVVVTSILYFGRLFVQKQASSFIKGHVKAERLEPFTESFWKFVYYTIM
jgi:hypothetical protein